MKLINSLKKYSKNLYRYYTKSTFSFLKVIPSIVLLIILILLSFPVFINHINDWKGIITVIIFVSIFFLIEQIMLAKRSQEIDELYEENENFKMNTEALIQTVEALPQDYLKYCFEELELTNKDRISVYILDDKNFIIIS